ncbi:MAG TPA: azurin [Cryomorphaceae bacterium]|nr:azurin [Cryomorphaceae bacterium]
MKKAVLILASAAFMMSCGSDGTTTTTTEDTSTTPATEQTETRPENIPDEVTITISGDDQMKYDKTELTVYEGQKVTLVLKHTGSLPKHVMGHNWTLLKEGVDWAGFDREALNYKDNDYIPTDTKDIIVHTDMIGGGEETSVTFEAPAKGTYYYLCTFPGHASQMHGTLTVK